MFLYLIHDSFNFKDDKKIDKKSTLLFIIFHNQSCAVKNIKSVITDNIIDCVIVAQISKTSIICFKKRRQNTVTLFVVHRVGVKIPHLCANSVVMHLKFYKEFKKLRNHCR